MARRFWWFAATLVLALLVVTSDCLRQPAKNDEGQETTIRIRGDSRFNPKVEQGVETTPIPFTTVSRSSRRGTSHRSVPSTVQPVDKKYSTPILKDRRDHDRNIGLTAKPTASEIPSRMSRRKAEITRRSSQLRRQTVEPENDLARAATEDRKYLPNSKEPRPGKAQIQVNLKAPLDTLKTVSGNRSNFARSRKFESNHADKKLEATSTSMASSENTTPSSRFRKNQKMSRKLSSGDFMSSQKVASRRSWSGDSPGSAESTESILESQKSSGRRIIERSTRRHDTLSPIFDEISTALPSKSTTVISQKKISNRSREPGSNEKITVTSSVPISISSGVKRSSRLTEISVNKSSLSPSIKSDEKVSKGSDIKFRNRKVQPRFGREGRQVVEGLEKVEDGKKSETPRKLDVSKKRERSRKSASFENKARLQSVTSDPQSTTTAEALSATSQNIPTSTDLPDSRSPSSTSTVKTLSKEDYYNHGLGFRGRKVGSAPSGLATTGSSGGIATTQTSLSKTFGWTLSRRHPSSSADTPETSSAPSTISNEIPSSDDTPRTSTAPNRNRGSKLFNKASVILKIDRELEEGDNYPPEFKAKLAQLKNSDTKNTAFKPSSRVSEDDRIVTLNRHSRSIDNPDPEDDEFSEDIFPILITTTSLVDLQNQDSSDGLKKQTSDSSGSAQSRQKLARVKMLNKADQKNGEILEKEVQSTTLNPTQPFHPELLKSEEPRRIKAPKQFGTSRLSTTTDRASVTLTFPTIDKKLMRTAKSITRGTVREGKTTSIKTSREIISTTSKPDDNPVVQTTLLQKLETTTVGIKLPSIDSRFIVSREKLASSTTERPTPTNRRIRPWNAAYIDRDWQEPTSRPSNFDKEITSRSTLSTTKRSKFWNAAHLDKDWRAPTEKTRQVKEKTLTTPTSIVTSTNRYERRKPESIKHFESINSSTTIQKPVRRYEFRPRTATYRRHSESTGVHNVSEVKDNPSISITPKVPTHHTLINIENSTQRSAKQEPALAISNLTNSNDTNNSMGISLSSRGNSGNSDSNIFNPTKTTYLISSNASLLEQLRSTVAPLLSVLGNKSPIFSGSYSNVNNMNSQSRVTPSGAPPRFSARYRGTELFVKKPNIIDSEISSTTPNTSTKDAPGPPMIAISSPGEPKVITFYQALESASITNEIDQTTDNAKQLRGVVKVEINNNATTEPNVTSNAVNNTASSLVTKLEQVVAANDSLTMLNTSQSPGNDTTVSTTFLDTTPNPFANTEMPQDDRNFESDTTTVSSSFVDMDTTLSSLDILDHTPSISEVNIEINDMIKMMQNLDMPAKTESPLSLITSRDSQDNISSVTKEPIQNIMKVMNEFAVIDVIDEITTILPDNLAAGSTTMIAASDASFESSTNSEPLIKGLMEVATIIPEMMATESTTLATEIETSGIATSRLDILAQYTEATTQVMDIDKEVITTFQSVNTTPFDRDNETSTKISESITTTQNTDVTESPSSSTTNFLSPADNEFLTQIMNRLLNIFSRDNTTHSQNILQGANKSDDGGQMLGGFLDNTNRNITLDVNSSEVTESPEVSDSTERSGESSSTLMMGSMLQTQQMVVNELSTALIPEQSSEFETTTIFSEIQTMVENKVAAPESTTLFTNPISSPDIDNNPLILTSISPDIMETTIPSAEEIAPLVTTTPVVTTNPPTSTQSTMASDNSPITDDPNMLAGFQDRMPATAQSTAGPDAQATTSKTTITPSIESTSSLSQSVPTTLSTSSTIPITPMPDMTTQTSLNVSTTPVASSSTDGSTSPASTTQYAGRFGASRITPAPRFSSSSTTSQPLRDYHVYGIYPNKTIVRKRPEDNLIDARNVDSPYVIFGIYPDGKLVRKYPNGTVIPDPPSNPVEIVFSLSTTTNRPSPVQQFNQFNGTNDPVSNNRPVVDVLTNPRGETDGYRSQLNLGLSSNALDPNGDGPNQSNGPALVSGVGNVGNQPASTKMTEVVSNIGVGASNNESVIAGLLTTSRPSSSATPSSDNSQGGRIIQDRETDKASRTMEAGGQRSTVYIGQEKFIDYWNDDPTNNNSRVVSVKINSITSTSNESPASSLGSLPDLEFLSDSKNSVSPSSKWKDPLDKIFGITTEVPVNKPLNASNSSDEPSASRSPITERPINPFSEVLTPVLDDAQLARDTSITTTTGAPSVFTTASTTTTTTPTTTTAATTTTVSSRPTTTTTSIPSTSPVTTSSTSTSPRTPSFTTTDVPRQTPFGSTFDDLAFLNSLLQPNGQPNSISSTPKTLTEVEQLLANKILSLALGNSGPTRSTKAIQPSNSAPNSLEQFPRPVFASQPIIIDLLQTTTSKSAANSPTTEQVTWRPVKIVTPTQTVRNLIETTLPTSTTTVKTPLPSTVGVWNWKSFPTHPPTTKPTTTSTTTTTTATTTTTTTTTTTMATTQVSTTKKPATTKKITSRPPPRPISTVAPQVGFGAGLLQAIFGRNIFAFPTTQRPASIKRPVQVTKKPLVTTPKPISTTTTPSPADDAKFLLELLSDVDNNGKEGKNGVPPLSDDDESFLRSVLNGQAKVKTTAPSLSASENSGAALLAQLLKSQGIEPSTPANQIREQLKAAGQPGSTSTNRPKLTTTRPRPISVPDRTPTSTYPPPLFSNFNFGFQRPRQATSEEANDGVRNQVLNAAIGATRVFSQFLGAAITGAAKQLQSFVRNGTRMVSEAAG